MTDAEARADRESIERATRKAQEVIRKEFEEARRRAAAAAAEEEGR